ncbi:MAG: histidinol-phosphate aminotransferase, partial [Comamonas sp.]
MTAQDIQSKALQRIRADVRAMQGYHIQPAQGLLKMDTMENPYRLPLELQKKLGEHLGALEINRY